MSSVHDSTSSSSAEEEYTIIGYTVTAEHVPISVTDTFLSAVENCEMHALTICQAIDEKLESVAILTDETPAQAEGFFGRWTSFDEEKGVASLSVFHRYRKQDGLLMSGAWREKVVKGSPINVHQTPVDFFDGVYVPFDEASGSDSEGGGGDGTTDEEVQ